MTAGTVHHIAEVMGSDAVWPLHRWLNGEDGPNGMMADWLGQVSFKPRLVCVAIESDAHILANIRSNGVSRSTFCGTPAA